MEKTISKDEVMDVLKEAGSKFFTVKFIKKDKSQRSLTSRFGVKKDVKGDAASPSSIMALETFRANHPNLLRLYDINKEVPGAEPFSTKGAWRMVNLDTVYEIKSAGITYNVVQE